jgi:hypothetical protein
MPRTVTFLIILIGLVLSFGCSKDSGLPVIPADSNINAGIPVDDSSYQSDRNSFMGIYSMVIDTENLIAVIEPDRESMMHLNITSYLPAPTIVINSYDPSSGIVDVDFTIMNPYKLDAYDIRLIIYTDSYGHKLLNFDSWTGLFDIAGGLPINPFAAFAKDKPNRVFMQKASETVNLQILLPGGNPNVRFAIEGSYPSNCEEPYEINSFTQTTLSDAVGSTADVAVNVLDWQDDTTSVKLYAPSITGTTLVDFTGAGSDLWEMTLVNSTAAGEGKYTGYIVAYSSGTALYTEVTITVTAQGGQLDPVGDLKVTKLNRGEFSLDPEQISSVDFDWGDVVGAVEYSFERADGYTGNGWTWVATVSDSNFNFVPTDLDLDDDIRFRVIARAEPGGNPDTDSIPSEEVFILFMSSMGDMGGTYENNWTITRKDVTDGIYITRWYWSVDYWGECALGFYGDNSLGKDTNTWAIAYTPFEVPDLEGMTEAYCDGYISPGANWSSETLGFCIGTISETPTPGITCPDFDPANDIFDPTYFAYNNPNCDGINSQFDEVNQAAWKLTPDFGPPEVWRHVGYYLNDLLEPERDFIALGYANGNVPLTPGGS